MSEPFAKLFRGPAANEILAELLQHHGALAILIYIAVKARWTAQKGKPNLQPGQAILPGFRALGFSSDKAYRVAKEWLIQGEFMASNGASAGANKGTVVTLLDNGFLALNLEPGANSGANTRANQGRARGEQGASSNPEKADNQASPYPIERRKKKEECLKRGGVVSLRRTLIDEMENEFKDEPPDDGDKIFGPMKEWRMAGYMAALGYDSLGPLPGERK